MKHQNVAIAAILNRSLSLALQKGRVICRGEKRQWQTVLSWGLGD